MSFDGELYSHNTHRQFMIIKEKYNANEDVDTYQSLYHKVMFMQMNIWRKSGRRYVRGV